MLNEIPKAKLIKARQTPLSITSVTKINGQNFTTPHATQTTNASKPTNTPVSLYATTRPGVTLQVGKLIIQQNTTSILTQITDISQIRATIENTAPSNTKAKLGWQKT